MNFLRAPTSASLRGGKRERQAKGELEFHRGPRAPHVIQRAVFSLLKINGQVCGRTGRKKKQREKKEPSSRVDFFFSFNVSLRTKARVLSFERRNEANQTSRDNLEFYSPRWALCWVNVPIRARKLLVDTAGHCKGVAVFASVW